METVYFRGQMGENTKVNTKMTLSTVKENSFTKTDKSMKAAG